MKLNICQIHIEDIIQKLHIGVMEQKQQKLFLKDQLLCLLKLVVIKELQMSKPKEFWLIYEGLFTPWISSKPLFSVDTDEEIHVIEYGAYEDLKTSMRSWEVAREIEIYANSDKQ